MREKFIDFLKSNQILQEYKEEIHNQDVRTSFNITREESFSIVLDTLTVSRIFRYALSKNFAFNYDRQITNIDWALYDKKWKLVCQK